jgi:hypothetical protein
VTIQRSNRHMYCLHAPDQSPRHCLPLKCICLITCVIYLMTHQQHNEATSHCSYIAPTKPVCHFQAEKQFSSHWLCGHTIQSQRQIGSVATLYSQNGRLALWPHYTVRTADSGRWFSVAQCSDASRTACAVTLFRPSNNSDVEVIGSLLLVH